MPMAFKSIQAKASSCKAAIKSRFQAALRAGFRRCRTSMIIDAAATMIRLVIRVSGTEVTSLMLPISTVADALVVLSPMKK